MEIQIKRNKQENSQFPSSLLPGEPMWFKDKLYVGSVGTTLGGQSTTGTPIAIGAPTGQPSIGVFFTAPGQYAEYSEAILAKAESLGYEKYAIIDPNDRVYYDESDDSFHFNDQKETNCYTSESLQEDNFGFSLYNNDGLNCNDLGIMFGIESLEASYKYDTWVCWYDTEDESVTAFPIDFFNTDNVYIAEMLYSLFVSETDSIGAPSRVDVMRISMYGLVRFDLLIRDATLNPDWDADSDDWRYIKNRTHWRDLYKDNNLPLVNETGEIDVEVSSSRYVSYEKLLSGLDFSKKYTVQISVDSHQSKTYREITPFNLIDSSYTEFGLSDVDYVPSQGFPGYEFKISEEYQTDPNVFFGTTLSLDNTAFGINDPEATKISTSINIKETVFDKKLYSWYSSGNVSVENAGSYYLFADLTQNVSFEDGMTYFVDSITTDYAVTTKSITFPGFTITYIGNLSLADSSLDDTGEDFLIYTLNNSGTYLFVPNSANYQDDSNSSYFSVYPNIRYEYHKLDERYIPVSGTDDGTNWTSLTIGSTTKAIPQGGSSLPSQDGNNGKILTTDGTDASWASLNSAIPTLTSPVRIWDLEPGVYILPDNCEVFYTGSTYGNSIILHSSILSVTSNGIYKRWICWSADGNNSDSDKYCQTGYMNSSDGVFEKFYLRSSSNNGTADFDIYSYTMSNLNLATGALLSNGLSIGTIRSSCTNKPVSLTLNSDTNYVLEVRNSGRPSSYFSSNENIIRQDLYLPTLNKHYYRIVKYYNNTVTPNTSITNADAKGWVEVFETLPALANNAGKVLAVNSNADGVEWVSQSGGGSSTLSGLTDTTISSPADGEILQYDSTTSKWVNSAIAGANNSTITIQKNGTAVDTFTLNQSTDKSINITVPTSASDVNALPSSTKYGSSITTSIDSSTYVLSTTLKDQDGNTLGTVQTVDLPLETMVVSGSYDSTNKKVVLTLKNGSTVDFSVADLVSGLQSEITSSNKLSADLISDGTTNKAYTATEKTKLSGIETGAQVNVKPDWNAASGAAAEILNKPTIPTVNNATLTIQKNGTTVNTFTANASSNVTANISVRELPEVTSSDNNKILMVVNGAWAAQTVDIQSYYTGSSEPSNSIGNNGDLYLQTN